jgi:hypothetical protein
MSQGSADGDAVERYRRIRDRWHGLFGLWNSVHYALGIAALVISSFLAAKQLSSFLDTLVTDVLAWILALLTALITFLGPQARANRYRRAWLLMDGIITQWEIDVDHHITAEDVMRAHQQGERIVSDEPGANVLHPPLPPATPPQGGGRRRQKSAKI